MKHFKVINYKFYVRIDYITFRHEMTDIAKNGVREKKITEQHWWLTTVTALISKIDIYPFIMKLWILTKQCN